MGRRSPSISSHGFDTAAITGDFVLLGQRGQPVNQGAASQRHRDHRLHSHMLDDRRASFFAISWPMTMRKLATGLRAALDKVDVRSRSPARDLFPRRRARSPGAAMKRVTMWPALVACSFPRGGWAEDPAPWCSGEIRSGRWRAYRHFAIRRRLQLLFVAQLGNDSVGIVS